MSILKQYREIVNNKENVFDFLEKYKKNKSDTNYLEDSLFIIQDVFENNKTNINNKNFSNFITNTLNLLTFDLLNDLIKIKSTIFNIFSTISEKIFIFSKFHSYNNDTNTLFYNLVFNSNNSRENYDYIINPFNSNLNHFIMSSKINNPEFIKFLVENYNYIDNIYIEELAKYKFLLKFENCKKLEHIEKYVSLYSNNLFIENILQNKDEYIFNKKYITLLYNGILDKHIVKDILNKYGILFFLEVLPSSNYQSLFEIIDNGLETDFIDSYNLLSERNKADYSSYYSSYGNKAKFYKKMQQFIINNKLFDLISNTQNIPYQIMTKDFIDYCLKFATQTKLNGFLIKNIYKFCLYFIETQSSLKIKELTKYFKAESYSNTSSLKYDDNIINFEYSRSGLSPSQLEIENYKYLLLKALEKTQEIDCLLLNSTNYLLKALDYIEKTKSKIIKDDKIYQLLPTIKIILEKLFSKIKDNPIKNIVDLYNNKNNETEFIKNMYALIVKNYSFTQQEIKIILNTENLTNNLDIEMIYIYLDSDNVRKKILKNFFIDKLKKIC